MGDLRMREFFDKKGYAVVFSVKNQDVSRLDVP
jgi:hypothetical protein